MIMRQKNMIIALISGVFLIFLGLLSFLKLAPQNEGFKVIDGTESGSMKEVNLARIGLTVGWSEYQPESEEQLTLWKPETVKILFRYVQKDGTVLFLADVKRSQGKKKARKDGKWEFPGGRRDPGESPTESLLRELSEEDPSGVLATTLKNKLSSFYFKNLMLNNGEHHTLLLGDLIESDIIRLKSYWNSKTTSNHEVYQFVLVPAEFLDSRHPEFKKYWTPKTKKIIKSLKRA